MWSVACMAAVENTFCLGNEKGLGKKEVAWQR